jgi:predicted regulator of Ras-like GTPase activity (Roadblock/LC7/MglB family)
VTPASAGFSHALDLITRVRGVRGAMLVSADDGIVVAEQLMEGIKGPALAALAASLATRLRRAMEAAGVGAGLFWHLQAEQGTLLVVPSGGGGAGGAGGAGGILVVAVAEPDVNVGLVRLELLRGAEAVR